MATTRLQKIAAAVAVLQGLIGVGVPLMQFFLVSALCILQHARSPPVTPEGPARCFGAIAAVGFHAGCC
jgi:hypothetical protein